MSGRTRGQRGSAVVLAALVILVLAVVGIAVAYTTQFEDRISGNARLDKAAFYAADAGLRAGEVALQQAVAAGGLDSLIYDAKGSGGSGGNALPLPGGGNAVPLRIGAFGETFLKRPIQSPVGAKDQARFGLYVRNNDEDPGGATANTDRIVNLVAVGEVFLSGEGPGAETALSTRILEEQLAFPAEGGPAAPAPLWWRIVK